MCSSLESAHSPDRIILVYVDFGCCEPQTDHTIHSNHVTHSVTKAEAYNSNLFIGSISFGLLPPKETLLNSAFGISMGWPGLGSANRVRHAQRALNENFITCNCFSFHSCFLIGPLSVDMLLIFRLGFVSTRRINTYNVRLNRAKSGKWN